MVTSAGARIERTTNASMSTPIVIIRASSRSGTMGTIASTANDIAMTRPATVIEPDARGAASMTASSTGRVRAASQMRPTTKIV